MCGFFDEGCVSRQIVDTIHELYLLFGNRESSNIKGREDKAFSKAVLFTNLSIYFSINRSWPNIISK